MTHKRHYELLNRILHHPDHNPDDFLVIYEHRGAPQGLKKLRVSALVHVSRRTMVLHHDIKIPLHRIVQIRNRHTGEILAGKELDERILRGIQEEVVPQASQVEAEWAALLPAAQAVKQQAEKRVFFTADYHLGHAKIIEHCRRPYSSVEEMDRDLIARWNAVVGEDDIVYHLGDFTLGGPDKAQMYFQQLNGLIHVLPGSHDHKWFGKQDYLSRSGHIIIHEPPLLTLTLGFPKKGRKGLVIVLCHYAMRVWPLSHYGSLHLYGHSHGRLPPQGRSLDVGVDVRREPFEPEEIEALLESRSEKRKDK